MRINFCLPSLAFNKIVGGYKIVYEYANRLNEKGHDIAIVYNCKMTGKKWIKLESLRRLICRLFLKVTPNWFKLNKNIKRLGAYDGLVESQIPDGDVIFATAVETAEEISRVSPLKGKKFYLIQDFENWKHTDEYVKNTYGMGFCNIAISKWLADMVKSTGNDCFCLSNPIDSNIYKCLVPITQRKKHSIGILFHSGEHKGFKYAYQVACKLMEKYPDLELWVFGSPKRPTYFKDNIHYIRNATQKQLIELYNKVRVFLCMSLHEGFGLTGAEAMACGCALVSTRYDGVLDYANDKENSILIDVGDVDGAIDSICKLFEDDKLLMELSANGQRTMQDRDWRIAVDRLENFLLNSCC